MLANLATDDSIANERDSLGGGGVLNSGAYLSTISMAYLTTSQGGAMGMVLHLKTEEGREFRQTLWMTSGTAKGCKNYYEKDGKKQYLPGFILANGLCLLTVGKEVAQMDTEDKVVNVYSPEAKAEVPTKVKVFMDLLGKDIYVGLIKQVVDKTAKNDATGVYEPTGETREENDIDKLFRGKDKLTVAEIRAQATESVFFDQWVAKWEGKTKERAKGAAGNGVAGAPRVGAAAAQNKKPSQSLFA